jgi:hypothetical protein
MRDRTHCGGCAGVCADGEYCEAGVCTPTCSPGLEVCDGACVDTTNDPVHCGECGNDCAAGGAGNWVCMDGVCGEANGCLLGGRQPPAVCLAGDDPGTGADWVVCAADCDTAWISANSFGQYHYVRICTDLGYSGVSQWGGTCGNVCGFCEGVTSCADTGNRFFNFGAAAANCGADAMGAIICNTVMWECER